MRRGAAVLMAVVGLVSVLTSPVAALPAHPCAVGAGRTPVLLVHGFKSSAGTWDTGKTRRDLSKIPGAHVEAFDYRAVSTNWVTDPRIGPALASRIVCLSDASRATGGTGKVALVAHSMGGLTIRCALAQSCAGIADVVGRVGLVVTLGTPNEGSFLRGGTSLSQAEKVLGWAASTTCQAADAPAHGALSGFCDQVQALGTSAAAAAFTPGSRELRRLPVYPAGVPVYAVAGRVAITDSLFGVTFTLAGDAGDLVVGTDSATAAHTGGALGGSTVLDCGAFDVALFAFAGGRQICWHNTEPKDDSFDAQAIARVGKMVTADQARVHPRVKLPAIASDAKTAGGLTTLLRSAGVLADVNAQAVCTEVDVYGADFATGDADVVVAHEPTGSCTGPFATFWKIRSNVVTRHADECDCGTQTAAWTQLVAPYRGRTTSPFHSHAGVLAPGVLLSTAPALQDYAYTWIAYPAALGSPDVFTIHDTGAATIDMNDGKHVGLSVTAVGAAARASVTESTDPALPNGTLLTLRRGSGEQSGLVVSGSSRLPSHWCTTGIGVCS
jgi:pimeloyl-ACP methyl ester carboxylesterase